MDPRTPRHQRRAAPGPAPSSRRGERRSAAAALIERHRGAVIRLCAARCGTAAEDVAQTAFEQFYRDMGSPQEIRSPGAWLFAIARRRCADHLRKVVSARRFIAPAADETLEQTPDSAPWSRVDREIDEPERRRLLGTLLGLLPVRVAFAIVLRHIEGFTYPEMAELCGEAPETLRQRVERGLSSLRARAPVFPPRS